MPLSLAIACSRRLALVTQPLVPLTKQMANITVNTVAAALLPVAKRINSVIGMFVGELRAVSTSVMQKSITRMNTTPLQIVSTFYESDTGDHTSHHQRRQRIYRLEEHQELDSTSLRPCALQRRTQSKTVPIEADLGSTMLHLAIRFRLRTR
jgi:hypothetical protein